MSEETVKKQKESEREAPFLNELNKQTYAKSDSCLELMYYWMGSASHFKSVCDIKMSLQGLYVIVYIDSAIKAASIGRHDFQPCTFFTFFLFLPFFLSSSSSTCSSQLFCLFPFISFSPTLFSAFVSCKTSQTY